MKRHKWILMVVLLILIFLYATDVTSHQHVNVIKYIDEDDISYVTIETPPNVKEGNLEIYDLKNELIYSFYLQHPMTQERDRLRHNNIFYIPGDRVSFDRFHKVILRSKQQDEQIFDFSNVPFKLLEHNISTTEEREGKNLKVMTYNIHHGKNLIGMYTLDQIADIIEESGADIIGLQEVDSYFARSKFQDQMKYLAERLSMYYIYGDNVNIIGAKYGNGILSKYPIVSYENFKLPSGREQRGLLSAIIDVDGEEIAFLNTHLGLNSNERMKQVKAIENYISILPYPTILVGDFNAMATSEEIQYITSRLIDVACFTKNDFLPTFEVPFISRRIDYILVDPAFTIENYRVIRERASDHYPVLSALRIN